MKIRHLGPAIIFTPRCDSFSSWGIAGLATYRCWPRARLCWLGGLFVVPVENLSSGSVHETWLPFSSGSHPSSGRNCSGAYIHQLVDGGSRSYLIGKDFSHPQALVMKEIIDEQYPEAQIEVTTASASWRPLYFRNILTSSYAVHCTWSSAEEYGLNWLPRIFKKWTITRLVWELKSLVFPCKHKLRNDFGLDLTWQPSRCTYKACLIFVGEELTWQNWKSATQDSIGRILFIIDVDYADKALVHFAQKN